LECQREGVVTTGEDITTIVAITTGITEVATTAGIIITGGIGVVVTVATATIIGEIGEEIGEEAVCTTGRNKLLSLPRIKKIFH